MHCGVVVFVVNIGGEGWLMLGKRGTVPRVLRRILLTQSAPAIMHFVVVCHCQRADTCNIFYQSMFSLILTFHGASTNNGTGITYK